MAGEHRTTVKNGEKAIISRYFMPVGVKGETRSNPGTTGYRPEPDSASTDTTRPNLFGIRFDNKDFLVYLTIYVMSVRCKKHFTDMFCWWAELRAGTDLFMTNRTNVANPIVTDFFWHGWSSNFALQYQVKWSTGTTKQNGRIYEYPTYTTDGSHLLVL